MVFLSADWMVQVRAFPSQFTILLEGTTLCKGTDGLLCSYKPIPCEPRHQVQAYVDYNHRHRHPHPFFFVLYCPSHVHILHNSVAQFTVVRGLRGVSVLSHARHCKQTTLTSSILFYDTLTLLAKCWLPATSSDPCQVYVRRSCCRSVTFSFSVSLDQGYSGQAVMVLSCCQRRPVMTWATRRLFSGCSPSRRRLDSNAKTGTVRHTRVTNAGCIEYRGIIPAIHIVTNNDAEPRYRKNRLGKTCRSISLFSEDQFWLIHLCLFQELALFQSVKLVEKLAPSPCRSQGLGSQLDVYDVVEGCCRHLLWTDSLSAAYSRCKDIKLKTLLAIAY